MQKNEEKCDTIEKNDKGIDIDSPGIAKAVSRRILEDIDSYCVKAYDGGHRNHLGGSAIGDSCARKLWYVFRWCFREETDGRKQRLFNRGHREEERFIEWLTGIGAKVWFENPETKEQYRVSAVMGHFGGSLDAIIVLPERYKIFEPILGEFKTNKAGSAFKKLCETGMILNKPQHYAQTCCYGSDPAYNFRYVLYMNICKDNDALHVELVKLDHSLGEQMRNKAERIILTQEAPARLSDNPTYRECGWCGAKKICHENALPECNCRSCKNARPVQNKEWFCEFFNGIIPKDFLPKACKNYFAITIRKRNV